VTAAAALLDEAWGCLGLWRPASPVVTGPVGLPSALPVADLAVGAVSAQLAAARAFAGARQSEPLAVDGTHVGLAFRSERYVRLAGRPVGAGFAPLSRLWRTADGWLRLHANYPHHRAAALRVLGARTEDPEAVAALVLERDAGALEAAVVAAGGAAAALRDPAAWAAHEQGRAVAAAPLIALRRVTDAPRRQPAERLRVLDLTRVIAGPVATRTLASHGADVLRIDSPRLPDDRDALLDTGVGKRHVELDLADPQDRGTAEELVRSADVVVQGYRPGALDRFGFDPASLLGRHPHLVVVRLSAWGIAGPWGGRRGFDSLVQVASGIAHLCGTDGVPGVLPAQALDHGTGHLAAATVLGALARQRDEGGGWLGELSLARTAHWLLSADPAPPVPAGTADPDPTPYLVDLPRPEGAVTVVRPPGSPDWRHAAALPGEARPEWLPA
jgi:crotonobetainyl-CoA:carnitine CoA-transferase CaiB-like acyl-CoA transferase